MHISGMYHDILKKKNTNLLLSEKLKFTFNISYITMYVMKKKRGPQGSHNLKFPPMA